MSNKVETDILLDTCVVLDGSSIKNLEIRAGRAHEDGLSDLWEDPHTRSRMRRLGWGALLLWQLRRDGAVASCYMDELEYILDLDIATEEKGGVREIFGTVFAWYLHGEILRPWRLGAVDDLPKGLRSNDTDDALVALAKGANLPLITQEGWSTDGSVLDRGIREKAIKAKVTVWTSQEYVLAHCSWIEELRQDFLREFHAGIETFAASQNNAKPWREALLTVFELYDKAMTRDCLFG